MKTQPDNWPINAPAYHSQAGWEFEKKMAEEKLRNELMIKKASDKGKQ